MIGVAASEDKRGDHDTDAEPHGRFPTYWSGPVGHSFGRCVGKSAITRSVAGGGDLIEQRTLNFNSKRRQEYAARLSPHTRRG